MVNGSFRCLGTPQQLKSRYGDGYRLKLRLSGGDLEPIQEFVRQNFPHSVLKVCQCSVLYILHFQFYSICKSHKATVVTSLSYDFVSPCDHEPYFYTVCVILIETVIVRRVKYMYKNWLCPYEEIIFLSLSLFHTHARTHARTHTHTQEKHLNTLVYQLPPTGLKLSEAFRLMERGRETLVRRSHVM